MKASGNIAEKICLFVLVICETQAQYLSFISKRATGDNGLYKFAERDGGCFGVHSMEPCPISWKLSAIAAKFYKQQTRLISLALTGLESLKASDECKIALKVTMCSQAAPKCSEDGSQDYGEAATTCAKVYSKCPQQFSELLKLQKLCDNIISGKLAKPKCVKPSNIEGNCPQPKYKMPTDALYLYKRFSANDETMESLAQVNASSQCKSEVQEMQCVAVYCSEDEKHLLTEFTRAECVNTTKLCIINDIEKLTTTVPFLEDQLRPIIEKIQDVCDVYPVRSIISFFVEKLFA